MEALHMESSLLDRACAILIIDLHWLIKYISDFTIQPLISSTWVPKLRHQLGSIILVGDIFLWRVIPNHPQLPQKDTLLPLQRLATHWVSPYHSSYYSHGLIHGHIFVHKYSSKPDVQTWNGTSWSSITTGCQHPSLTNYKFNVLHNGEPSWITRKSAMTYQSKRKSNWMEK